MKAKPDPIKTFSRDMMQARLFRVRQSTLHRRQEWDSQAIEARRQIRDLLVQAEGMAATLSTLLSNAGVDNPEEASAQIRKARQAISKFYPQ